MGFTDDRKYIWAGRLDDNKIFIFDVGTDPAKPTLANTITDFDKQTGYVGPHTFYALPGRMLIGALSNTKDHGGVTGMAVYSNDGKFLSAHPMPTTDGGDGYGYDIGINPQKNALLTSSFTGWNNYMMDMGKLIKDEAAMKNFGKTMVMWNLKSLKPDTIFEVPGAPLEIRWSLNTKEGDDWAITATALTSKLWLVNKGADGKWQAKAVADIGDASKIPLPVDISIAATARALGQYLHGWDDAPLRPLQPGEAGANLREEDWQPGEHGFPELGRQARLHHHVIARQLGQEGRR